jgi:transposase
MSNIIKMELQQSIRSLKNKGWSDRRISRELGVNRRTVKRYCADSKCTNPQTGKKGPVSSCEPYREQINEWFDSGLSIERIHHDLSLEHGFGGSYHSVYRFVQSLDVDTAKRIYRIECEPGQEAQIDYGTLYLPIGEDGRRKKVHILLVTLSHSRKAYVEAGVKYVKNNALKGKSFKSLAEVNEHLRRWMSNVADKRIHGTTKRQVGTHFEQTEKPALKPLPDSLFPCFEEAPRRVHRDSYVEVKGAYYHVPVQYVGKEVWARWDGAMVRAFNLKMEQIAAHVRLPRGHYTEVLGVGGCRGNIPESLSGKRLKVIPMGEHTLRWADGLIASNKEGALRKLQGLLRFKGKYPHGRINEAARKACIHGQYTLRELKLWIEAPQNQETFSFLQQHELIRNPNTYDKVAATGDLFD